MGTNEIQGVLIALKGHATNLANIHKYLPNVMQMDAVDARQADLSALPVHPVASAGIKKTYFSDSFQVPSKGAIGCALSHYEAWRKCVMSSKPMVVMEEDVVFDERTAKSVMRGLRRLPPNAMYATLINTPYSLWNLACPDRALVDSDHAGWYTLGLGTVGTQCYYINPAGAKILLENAYPVAFQVDVYIASTSFARPDFHAYATKHNPYATSRYLSDAMKSTIGEMGKPLKEGLGHFDLWLSNKILPTVDFWHELGFTPNDLTTFGVGTSAMALYFMYTGDFHGILPFALLRWYFDYADGILARKYDQVTVFGDWYDHMNDLVFVTTTFIIFLLKSKAYPFVSAGLFLTFLAFNMIQTGCIEKENDEERAKQDEVVEDCTLSQFKCWCVMPETMKYLDTTVLYVVTLTLVALFVSDRYNIF